MGLSTKTKVTLSLDSSLVMAIDELKDKTTGQSRNAIVEAILLQWYQRLDLVKQARGMLKGGPSLTQALLKARKEEQEREDANLPRSLTSKTKGRLDGNTTEKSFLREHIN